MPTPGVSAGLAYHWLFDGDTTDETGTLNLTEFGGISYAADVPSVVAGVASQSVDLDGTADYLNTGSSVTFKSVSCWFKLDSFTPQSRLFSWNNVNCSVIFRTTGLVETNYYNASGVRKYTSHAGLTTGDWHFLLFSGSATTNSWYIDGSLVWSTSDGFIAASNVLDIGNVSSFEKLAGNIQDFRLYSTSLDSTDAAAIYAGDWGGSPQIPTRRTLQLETRLNTRLRISL